MERPTKERIVGATLLVALVVLVVPEFLSGPRSPPATAPASSDAARTYTVDVAHLPSTTPVPAHDETASAVTPATLPAATAPPVTVKAPELAPHVPTPHAAAPQPVTAPVAAARAATPASHGWQIQLGSFASKANAETLIRSLNAKGFSAFDSPLRAAGSVRYRVRLGPYAERGAAERVMTKLKSAGHAGTLVPPT